MGGEPLSDRFTFRIFPEEFKANPVPFALYDTEGKTRKMLENAGAILDYLEEDKRRNIDGQMGFFDLPGAFVVPISTSLLPVLSGAIASKDHRQVDRISSTALRVTLLIGIPASVGMALFAQPICQLLLYNQPEVAQEAAPLLTMLSLAIAFSDLLFTTNSILQSFGRTTQPVIDMAVGGVVKVALSYVLIGIPQVAAMGSAISTVASYVVMVVLNVFALRSSLPKMDSVVKTALPLVLEPPLPGCSHSRSSSRITAGPVSSSAVSSDGSSSSSPASRASI